MTAKFEHDSRTAKAIFGKASQERDLGCGTLTSFLIYMPASDSKRTEIFQANEKDLHATFRELFPGLKSHDEVQGHYHCTILQDYRCYLTHSTLKKMFCLC